MISKNNHNLKIKQVSDRQLRFSLRKIGTGIVSVAIASLFFIGSSAMTIHADTSDGSTTTTVLTANSTNQSTTASDALTQSAATSDSAAQSTTADNTKDQTSTATDSANIATSTNSSTAQSTEADQTIINSKQNSTQAPATDNIQHGINITANNQATGYNGSSILNANQSDGTFDVNTVVTNNNSDSRKVEEIILLPTFTANNSTDVNMIKPVIDADKIGSGIQFTSSTGSMPTDLEVYYAITAGDFETLDVLMQNADFSWDQVVEIQFVATLQAGQSLTATVPMKIANLEQMKK